MAQIISKTLIIMITIAVTVAVVSTKIGNNLKNQGNTVNSEITNRINQNYTP